MPKDKRNYFSQGISEKNECTNCGRRNGNSVKFCKCGFPNEDYEFKSFNNWSIYSKTSAKENENSSST